MLTIQDLHPVCWQYLPWIWSTNARLLTLINVWECFFPSIFSLLSSACRFICPVLLYFLCSAAYQAAFSKIIVHRCKKLFSIDWYFKRHAETISNILSSSRTCHVRKRRPLSRCTSLFIVPALAAALAISLLQTALSDASQKIVLIPKRDQGEAPQHLNILFEVHSTAIFSVRRD